MPDGPLRDRHPLGAEGTAAILLIHTLLRLIEINRLIAPGLSDRVYADAIVLADLLLREGSGLSELAEARRLILALAEPPADPTP